MKIILNVGTESSLLYSCLFLTVTYVFCVGCFSDHSSVSNPCLAGLCPSLSEASSSMTEDNNGNF